MKGQLRTLPILFSMLAVLGVQKASEAQSVSINTTANPPNPNSMLDVSSSSKGLLIPRLSTAQRTGMGLAAADEGMTVYDKDTKSYWLWDGTAWVEFDMDATNEYNTGFTLSGTTLQITDGGGTLGQDISGLTDSSYWDRDKVNGWLFPSTLSDNVGVGDATPEGKLDVHGRVYIAGNGDVMNDNAPELDLTIDDDEVGSNTGLDVPGNDTLTFFAGGTERARMFPNGVMAVNTQAVVSGQTFYSVGAGNDNAILGAVGGSGSGVRGENTGGTGNGVTGLSDNTDGIGVVAVNTDPSGTGLVASGNNAMIGTFGGGSGGNLIGDQYGGIGIAENATSGIGIGGIGNGGTTLSTPAGSGAGVAGTGERFGVYGLADSVPGGIGVLGVGNNLSTFSTPTTGEGAGVVGAGQKFGVWGDAENTTSGWGGFFQVDGSSYSFVGGYNGAGTAIKITGPGSVSSIVENDEGEDVQMFAPEAPEILFTDYGESKLENGEARVKLDPTYKKNVKIDEEHPLRVFVQVEGECKGVYVAEKDKNGFTVKELDKGNSDVTFTYKVVANRKDEERRTKDGKVKTVPYQDVRFPEAPKPSGTKIQENSGTKLQKRESQGTSIQSP